jgi:hypothetical protein
MVLKKIIVSNSRFFYLPHHGKVNEWAITLGKVLNKMEKDTPFISANSFCDIFVLSSSSLLVGKEVIGPIRGDISDIFLADFKMGEIERTVTPNSDISFPDLFERAQEITRKRSGFRDIFSIRINQKDPILGPMELRFYPNDYAIPKLTI